MKIVNQIIPDTSFVEQEIYLASGDVRTRFVGFRLSKNHIKNFGDEDMEDKRAFRGDRKACTEFSARAQKEARLKLRALGPFMQIIAHFTYPLEMKKHIDGLEVKRHFKNFLNRLRYRFPDIKYAWVLEFQIDTQMPHFHVMFNQFIDKEIISRLWYDAVGSGLLKHYNAGTRVEFIRLKDRIPDYFLKYLQKKEQKIVPAWFKRVGRFWGYSRGCIEKVVIVTEAPSNDFQGHCLVKRGLRPFRRWYEAKNRQWSQKRKGRKKKDGTSVKGYKWKWRGSGWVAWGGAEVLKQLYDFSQKQEEV